MQPAGLGHSTRSDPADAAAEAVSRACEGLSGAAAGAALVVSTGAYGGEVAARALARSAARELGHAEIVGAGLDGLMVGAREWTAEPAVAAMVLPAGLEGVEIVLLEDLGGHEAEAGEELRAAFGAPLDSRDLVVVFSEPHALDGRALARGLDQTGLRALAGISAGEATGESQPVWAGDEVLGGGLAALRIRAAAPGASPRVALTQAGRPMGEPLRITRSRGHWIHSLEGRPALDVYREALPGPLREDLARAARSVLVALEPAAANARAGRRVRNVVGFDAGRGAFSVAEEPGAGDRLALVALDATSARDELGVLESSLAGEAPTAALYLNCRARAQSLFEHEGYELGRVAALLGGAPVLGLMGPHLYGRSRERAPLELHTYAALAALIDG